MYSFLLIVLLSPGPNCSESILSFSVDKVTTGTYSFVTVIWNVAFVGVVSLCVCYYSSLQASNYTFCRRI